MIKESSPLPPSPYRASLQNQKIKKADSTGKEKFDSYSFLLSLAEFAHLPACELQILADYSSLATFDSSSYITNEGDEQNAHGFIVVTGMVAMLKTSTSGKELIVELLQPRDTFGLMLKLAADKLPENLSARALQKTTILWVPLSNFFTLLRANPSLFKEFTAHLLLCLHSSYRLARGLAHDKVEIRIAAILSSLVLKYSKYLNLPHTINFTRQQLADLTGTTPETAIRITRAMQQEGIIKIVRPGVIQIINQRALQEMIDA